MASIPKPQFYLIRPGAEKITPTGQIIVQPAIAVPLIPADLLPEWVEVIGVPRSLSADETEDMGNLGIVHAEQHIYKLRFDPIAEDEAYTGDEVEDGTMSASLMRPSDSELSSSVLHESHCESHIQTFTPPTPHPSTPQSKLKPAQGLSSSRHNPVNQQQQSVQPRPDPQEEPSSQVLSPCRHWCHHGICKWGLDCHYEHTMPTTLGGLAEVGLSQFPDWWLQARGVIPMPLEVLRAADVPSARRMDKRLMGYAKRKPRFRVRAKRVGVQPVDLDETSEAEAEGEYEEESEMGNEAIQKPKMEKEGILIEF